MTADGGVLAIPPGLVLMAAGAAVAFLPRGTARHALVLAAPIAVLALVWMLPDGSPLSFEWLGYRLDPLRVDALSRLFATVFALAAFAGGLFATTQRNSRELAAAYIYAGAAIGAVFAGDLISLFVFWEVMALGSTAVIWSNGEGARKAGQRYIVIHLLGGVVLMAGIAGHVATSGDIAFTAMKADTPAHLLILAGFLLNAGAPPLSAWLPDAYPEASWSGTVFLSAFTTKTAVYTLLRGFPGEEILIWFGLIMIFYGIVYAILENDVRRILSYSIVNQVGFMVVGTGIGTPLALNGAAAHAFVHILYKALLLMSAGSVLRMTGKRNCSELGGLFRTMPWTTAAGIVGALAISAFPLTSGFVAKSMIADAAAGAHLVLVWFLLIAASAGVFLHAGIKFPWFVFFQKDSGLRPPEPPRSMRAAMALTAFLSVAIGVFPGAFYPLLPWTAPFAAYTPAHVVTQTQLLLFSGLAFFVFLGLLKRTATITLDTDWFWRRFPRLFAARIGSDLVRIGRELRRVLAAAARGTGEAAARQHGPAGPLAAALPTASMAFWVIATLAGLLALFYF
jgi:multicomponent Na+:H+ antiporter subunit D